MAKNADNAKNKTSNVNRTMNADNDFENVDNKTGNKAGNKTSNRSSILNNFGWRGHWVKLLSRSRNLNCSGSGPDP